MASFGAQAENRVQSDESNHHVNQLVNPGRPGEITHGLGMTEHNCDEGGLAVNLSVFLPVCLNTGLLRERG